MLGIRVNRLRLVVFAISSALAAAASILTALDVGIDPHAGFSVMLSAAVACIIGGLRDFLAPALGGIALGVVQSMVIWQTSAKWGTAVTFGMLVLFLLFRRKGLLGPAPESREAA